MKKVLTLSIILVIAGVYVYGVFAQPPHHGSRDTRRQPVMTNEQRAEEIALVLRKELFLSSKQYKKVLKLYNDRMKKVYPGSSSQTSSMPDMAGPGGRPSGSGMSSGGGRPSGGRSPMGGGRNMGGNRGPGHGVSGRQMNGAKPGNLSVAMKDMKQEPEKDVARRRKKMKKILSADQFRKWLTIEHNMLLREQEAIYRMREHEAWGRGN